MRDHGKNILLLFYCCKITIQAILALQAKGFAAVMPLYHICIEEM